MNRIDFQGMHELFDDGNMIWVENQINHLKGRVVGFEADALEVEVGSHCEKWGVEICREMTHGYKVKYGEVLKHPHEFDSHLD